MIAAGATFHKFRSANGGNDRCWHFADIRVNVRFQGVSSIGQCNTSCSLLAGVSKAKVFRGR